MTYFQGAMLVLGRVRVCKYYQMQIAAPMKVPHRPPCCQGDASTICSGQRTWPLEQHKCLSDSLWQAWAKTLDNPFWVAERKRLSRFKYWSSRSFHIAWLVTHTHIQYHLTNTVQLQELVSGHLSQTARKHKSASVAHINYLVINVSPLDYSLLYFSSVQLSLLWKAESLQSWQ